MYRLAGGRRLHQDPLGRRPAHEDASPLPLRVASDQEPQSDRLLLEQAEDEVRPGGWEEKLTETHALSSGLQWLGYNLFTERVFRHRRGGWSRLRYEDFVADPQAHADAITSWLEVDPNDGPFEGPDLVCLAGRYMIAGNPDRFDADAKRTRRDARWLERIRRRDRWIATALALPLLHKYGYRIRRAAAREYVSALPSS